MDIKSIMQGGINVCLQEAQDAIKTKNVALVKYKLNEACALTDSAIKLGLIDGSFSKELKEFITSTSSLLGLLENKEVTT